MANSQVRADIYPVLLHTTLPDVEEVTTYDKARIILTLDHVYVYQDQPTGPQLVFDDRLTSYTPPLPPTRVRKAAQLLDRTAKFETEDGYTGSFVKSGGCGCGSRLKNFPQAQLLPDSKSSISQAASTNDSV